MVKEVKEWKKLISTAHACTRIAHINSDLIRAIIPEADAKTIIRGKWTIVEVTGVKGLFLELKETSE